MVHYCGSYRTAAWNGASQKVVLEGDANYQFNTRIKRLNGELTDTRVNVHINYEDGKF